MSSKIKVDTIENVAGSGNVSLGSGHNLVVPGNLTVDTSTFKVDASSNKVLVGTTTPASFPTRLFTVGDTSFDDTALEIRSSTGTTGRLYFTDASDTSTGAYKGGVVYDQTNDFMKFETNGGNERVRIDNSGRVGIGIAPDTTSAGKTLQINDTVINDDDGSPGYTHFTRNAYYNNAWKYIENGSAEMLMFHGGTTTISTTSADNSGGADAALTWVNTLTLQRDGDISLNGASESTQNHQTGSILTKNLTGTSNAFEEGPRIEGSASDGNGLRHGGVGVIRTSGTGGGVTSGCGIGIYTSANTYAGYTQSRNNSLTYYFSSYYFAPYFDDSSNLGDGSYRWDNIYATNSTINTSDEREKQQIKSLSDKEMKAAKSLSKLFKNYKWNSAVTEKGDDARTHTGVIAQEISKAMSDEGLDATKYAFFTKDTWWESTDSKTKEVIKHKFKEDIPKDAIEKERYGVRYPELFSFIFSSIESRLTALESK